MDMASVIRTETSITIGKYTFDINLVNHHGWIGKEKYDTNELEIEKHLVNFHDEDIFFIVESYNINKIKEGYWDKYTEIYGSENYHSKIIGIDLLLYKEAIEKFEKLKAFI